MYKNVIFYSVYKYMDCSWPEFFILRYCTHGHVLHCTLLMKYYVGARVANYIIGTTIQVWHIVIRLWDSCDRSHDFNYNVSK